MSAARRRLAAAAALGLAGCGSSGPAVLTAAPPSAPPTPSTSTPAGAMAGFLAAAALQDNGQIPAWLATGTDTADLAEVLQVYNQFGNSVSGGLFWAVRGLHVTGAAAIDGTHAGVTLNGPVVWCLGRSANDPTAACSAVNGVAGASRHTYAAISVDGRWKVDVDIDASSQLDENPQATPGARATPSG